jgi:shikimate kinase
VLESSGPVRAEARKSELGEGYVIHEGCDHIFFVGFLGAGKSTLARNLGMLFSRPYVDTDQLVERSLGMSVCDVFASRGEEGFRDEETRVLEGLSSRKSLLVSCGGGVVERPENCELMHRMGVVVYLDGDLSDSLRQMRCPERRPDLGDAMHARALFRHRRPLYQQTADITIDIRNRTFEQVASESGQLLWERGLL